MRKQITRLFFEFTRSERNAALVLMICMIVSLILSNSAVSSVYTHFWHQLLKVSFLNFEWGCSLEDLINDGLMTMFFLLVGLEIKRELYEGELYPIKNAIWPLAAAIGGMLIPAFIYLLLNMNMPTSRGFGIPMATDIAFSLAVLSLVSHKVPVSLKILLTSLAIIDDLGSIVVIALFYGVAIQWVYLLASVGIFLILLLMNRLKIYHLTAYLVLGVPMWYCMLKSGIHATLSGVLLAFALPANYKDEKSPSIRMQEILHIPVGFIILPLFILANTAIPLKAEYIRYLNQPHALGIGLGLFLGKPLGIFLSTYLLVKLKIVSLSKGIGWYKIWATGMAAGIGFTMSIFITYLAFQDESLIQSSKLMILLVSFMAGIFAYLLFLWSSSVNEKSV